MRHIKLFSIFLIATTFFGSCLRDSEIDHTPYGYLVYVNAFTESQATSYFFNGRYTSTQNYREFQGIPVLTGSSVLVITDPLTNGTLLDTTLRFEEQEVYYSFFYGSREEPKLIFTHFEALPELANQAGIRFFHLANEVGPVYVEFLKDGEEEESYADREQETNESAEQSKAYNAVPTGTYTIQIRDGNAEGEVLATRENVVLSNEVHYTYILVGTPGSETHPLYIGEIK